MCAILCLFVEPVLASLLCIATRAIVRCHLYLLSSFSELLCLAYLHGVCFMGVVIRSTQGFIYGVLRIPYLQLHHIYLVSRVIALIPSVFTLSHPCTSLILRSRMHYYSLWMVRLPFLVSF
jgi:hypothetical protein